MRGAIMLGLALTIGCGASAATITRSTINGSAMAVEEMESTFFPRFRKESDACEARETTVEAYRACLGQWYVANVALQTATNALHLADDSWTSGEAAADGEWRNLLACAAEAVGTAVVALGDLGIAWPEGAEVFESIAAHGGDCAEVAR